MSYDWLREMSDMITLICDSLRIVWNGVVGIAPTVDGICLSFITYYTFRLTVFPKKLKFISFRESCSAFHGYSMEIILENRSLCPVVIEAIDLIANSKRIQFFNGECIVEGFKTAKIEMPPYTQIISDDGVIDNIGCTMGEISLLVKTTRGVQHIRYKSISRMAHQRACKLEEKYSRTTVCSNHYGDKIVSPGVRYAIAYIDSQGNKRIVLIHKSGVMSAALFGYNGLPKEVMKNETTVRSHFDAEFKKRGISYRLDVLCGHSLMEDISDQGGEH